MEAGNRSDHGALLRFGEFRKDGERENLAAGSFRYREVALLVAEIGEGFLEVQGNRIVDFRRNAAGTEMFAKVVAIPGANRELVVNVGALRSSNGPRYV